MIQLVNREAVGSGSVSTEALTTSRPGSRTLTLSCLLLPYISPTLRRSMLAINRVSASG